MVVENTQCPIHLLEGNNQRKVCPIRVVDVGIACDDSAPLHLFVIYIAVACDGGIAVAVLVDGRVDDFIKVG